MSNERSKMCCTKSSSLFDSLPEVVLRSILSFSDIPSLAALSATQIARCGNVASLASDDGTWFGLVQRRFGIGCKHRRDRSSGARVPTRQRGGLTSSTLPSLSSSLLRDGDAKKDFGSQREAGKIGAVRRRPSTYGGATWKDAYRSMSSAMRIPETRITGGGHGGRGSPVFASSRGGGRGGRPSAADFLGAWCMVYHEEDCRTKTVARRLGSRACPSNHHYPHAYRLDRRYIELKLCLQNTKSGFGSIVVPDLAAVRIAAVDEGTARAGGGHAGKFVVVKVGPWAPRIVLKQRFCEDESCRCRDDGAEGRMNAKSFARRVTLDPFELAVLSLHVACPNNLIYETDVLSSISSVEVPIAAMGWHGGGGSVENKDVSISRFIPEDALQDYYCQLPGGCLALIDRSRWVSV